MAPSTLVGLLVCVARAAVDLDFGSTDVAFAEKPRAVEAVWPTTGTSNGGTRLHIDGYGCERHLRGCSGVAPRAFRRATHRDTRHATRGRRARRRPLRPRARPLFFPQLAPSASRRNSSMARTPSRWAG